MADEIVGPREDHVHLELQQKIVLRIALRALEVTLEAAANPGHLVGRHHTDGKQVSVSLEGRPVCLGRGRRRVISCHGSVPLLGLRVAEPSGASGAGFVSPSRSYAHAGTSRGSL